MTLDTTRRTLCTAATLGLLLLSACEKDRTPSAGSGAPVGSATSGTPVGSATAPTADSPASDASAPAPPALSPWEDCVGRDPYEHDPGGQGQRVLGVGFIPLGYVNDPAPFRYFAKIDRFHDVTKDGIPVTAIRVEDHALTGQIARNGSMETLRGHGWDGVSLVGTLNCLHRVGAKDGRTIAIAARIRGAKQQPVRPPSEQSRYALNEAWLYGLEIQVQEGRGEWRPACNSEDDVVVPIAGYFDSSGKYDHDPGTLSFACMKRDAAKCEDAGYLADDAADKAGAKRELFNACTRMTTADYCGVGQSTTRDGSKIDTWDDRNVETEARKPVKDFHFEAAWTSAGAVCKDHLRWDMDVAWPAASPVTACFPTMPKCSSAEDAMKQFPGKALVFNKSCTTHPCGDEHLEVLVIPKPDGG